MSVVYGVGHMEKISEAVDHVVRVSAIIHSSGYYFLEFIIMAQSLLVVTFTGYLASLRPCLDA